MSEKFQKGDQIVCYNVYDMLDIIKSLKAEGIPASVISVDPWIILII